MVKKIVVSLLASSLLFGAGVYAGSGLEQVKAYKNPFNISIDGQSTSFENTPLLYNNLTYLPLAEISSKLGVAVEWNAIEKKVEIKKNVSIPGLTGMIVTANEGGSLTFLDVATQMQKELKVTGSVHNVQVSPDGKTVWATVVPNGGHAENHEGQQGAMNMADHANMTDSNGMSMVGQAEMMGENGMEMTDHAEMMGENGMEMTDHAGMMDAHAGDVEEGESAHGQTGGKLLVIDVASMEITKEMSVGPHPAHVVLTADGKYTLVVDNELNQVSIINAQTLEKIKDVMVGKMPHGTRISEDGKFAYTANMGESTVSVIDIVNQKEVKKLEVGKNPVQVGVTKDGKKLVATLNGENALAIVDLESGKVQKVKVGVGPAQVYVDPTDQFAYVANQGTEKSPSETASKVDLMTGKEIYQVKTGAGAHGVTTSTDGKYVFVTNMFADTVTVLESETGKVVVNQAIGDKPNGITFIK